MSAGEKIEALFPSTHWTGGSGIHKSLAQGYDLDSDESRKIMKELLNDEVGYKIWDILHANFGACEWLVDKEEFNAIFMQDVYGHIQGKGSSISPKMLKNPTTGNKFHRIALIGDIVGGVRYWMYHDSVWFRFRLEAQKESEEKTRKTIKNTAEEAIMNLSDIVEFIECGEPEVSKVKVRAKVQID